MKNAPKEVIPKPKIIRSAVICSPDLKETIIKKYNDKIPNNKIGTPIIIFNIELSFILLPYWI